MLKVSLFSGSEEHGPAAIPLFGPADSFFEKTASAKLLPEVANYIAKLRPRNDSQYVLVNAMGAGEYYGSNVNGDFFTEACLVHRPDDWRGIPDVDRIKAKDWAYGFPTFYSAQVFAHHRNKDSSKGFGAVELAAWNNHMKRVELVTRLDREKCLSFGGEGVWDKLKAGSYPDVSMGTRVPFDTCSITLDHETYLKAWNTFDPNKHKHPGVAILEFHKKLKEKNGRGIRGLSITRDDYSSYCRDRMNQILPDGRKVWVFNDFPRFFDLSYVFIGADKIAKAMMKIADAGRVYVLMGSAEVAEKLGMVDDEGQVKIATANKSAEMAKNVVPNQLAGKAVPLMCRHEKQLPKEVLNALGTYGLGPALASASGLGIVLRPREFQRIVLVCLGKSRLADCLEDMSHVFPKSETGDDIRLDVEDFSPVLASLLCPFMPHRSAVGPFAEQRVVVLSTAPASAEKESTSHSSELLRKIGAAYLGYRDKLMSFAPAIQDCIEKAASPQNTDLLKLAAAPAAEVFTPLSYHYLNSAFMEELGSSV